MSYENARRNSAVPFSAPDSIPAAPPLPAPRPLQRAREAATRFFGYYSRPASPQNSLEDDRTTRGVRSRYASLSATQNATASHRTGLEINTLSINEKGTHALIGGKEIFKTVKVEDGRCTEDLNLRSAIRSKPTQASGKARQIYSIDIADVAWAKGDCGDYVAAATSSGKIILYDLGHASLPAAQLHEHFRQVHRVTFNPHRGSLLLSGSQDGTVRLWDVRDVKHASTLHSKRKYSGQSDGVRDVKWSPTDGVDFALGTDSGWIQRWDMRNLSTAKVKIPAHSETCNSIDWHPDGKHIASASSDKMVRVWDFSTSRKQQKASWEIKAPYRVMNARWRPPCETSVPADNDARLCTQLVTAYDLDHPVLHIWDFRRPALPFREISPYPSAPTDLLWHSQDLLWTVGKEGVFLQTDIQYTSKIIDRRNLQAVAISPQNDLTFVTQKRPRRSLVPHRRAASMMASKSSSRSQSPERSLLSRSWTDDGVDQSFLSAVPTKREGKHSRGSTRMPSISTSTLNEMSFTATLKLDDALLNRECSRPTQVFIHGPLPLALEPEIFTFLARNYQVDLKSMSMDDDNFLESYGSLLKHNECCAYTAGLYRLAQTWRIVNFMMTNHLKKRARIRQKQRAASRPSSQEPIRKGTASKIANRLMDERSKSPTPTPSMKPVSALAQQLALSDIASDQPTPLAKPVTNIKSIVPPQSGALPDLEKDEVLALPPSISPGLTQSETSSRQLDQQGNKLTTSNLDGLQKLQQSTNGPDKAAMVRRWSIQPKEPLNLDLLDAKGVRIQSPKLEKHASNESFTFLQEGLADSFPSSFASTGSAPLQMVAERPSRSIERDKDAGKAGVETQDFDNRPATSTVIPVSQDKNPSALARRSDLLANESKSGNLNKSTIPEEEREGATDDYFSARQTSRTEGCRATVEETDPLPPKAAYTHLTHLAMARKVEDKTSHGNNTSRRSSAAVDDVYNKGKPTSLYLPRDDAEDIEEESPFCMVSMLRELVTYYAGKGDAQTAAHFLLLVGPLLPRTQSLPVVEIAATVTAYVDCFTAAGYTHEEIESILSDEFDSVISSGLQPLQIESVFSTYHKQLIKRRLLTEAAVLRRLCFPAYPSVYEDSLQDNSIHLRCGACSKPIGNGTKSLQCDSCHLKRLICPICWCDDSLFEENTTSSDKQSKLLSTCLLCNHTSHATCLRIWLEDGDGGCPTEGCLCDCAPGTWRNEKAKMLDGKRGSRGHSRVKSDEWSTQESKAVEHTREVLSGMDAEGHGLGFAT